LAAPLSLPDRFRQDCEVLRKPVAVLLQYRIVSTVEKPGALGIARNINSGRIRNRPRRGSPFEFTNKHNCFRGLECETRRLRKQPSSAISPVPMMMV
jgi:hypothetical protein